MAYDSQRGVTVLFGGEGLYVPASGFLADTWEWDGTTWTQRSPTTVPPVRSQHAMAYDSQRGRVVLFGGITNGPNPWSSAVPLGDTWEWDGTDWTQRGSTNAPNARCAHAMAYLSNTGRTMVVGGNDFHLATFNDTWEWDGTAWNLVQLGGFPPRSGSAITYAAQSGHAVMFGGYTATVGGSLLGDTWTNTGSFWQQVWPPSSPGPLYAPCMVYDMQRARAILFGGFGTWGGLADTWEWDGTTWGLLSTITSPPSMEPSAMAYDSQRGVTVLFGRPSGGSANETWELYGSANVATTQTYGSGCGAPAITIAPHPASRPLVGQTQISDINHASFGFAAVTWGATSQALPLDFLGITGCTLWNGAEFEIGSFCQSTSFTTAQHSLAIPFDVTLIGVHVYLQAWTLAPSFNPFGIVTSNGLELVLGVL